MTEISLETGNLSKRLDNLPIGVNDKLKINIIPKLKNMSYIPEIELPIVTGDTSFKYSEFKTGLGDIVFFSQNIEWYKYNLYKYSISNNNILQTTSFSTLTSDNVRVKISPDCKNIVYKNGYNLMCCLNGALNNPIVISDVYLTGLQSSYGFSDMAISNNGILAAYISDSIYIYDLNTNKMICKWRGIASDLSISFDGSYVAYNTNYESGLKTKIYKISNNTNTLIRDDFIGINLSFEANNNNKLYYYDYDDKKTMVIDCETNSILFYSPDYFYQIDFESWLATKMKSENIYEIIDLKNGMNTIYEYKSVNGTGRIKGDYIYFSTGVKCKFR